MEQSVTICWYPVSVGDMPDCEGTYLVAFDDGSVESYPMDQDELISGSIRAGRTSGVYWAESIPHPDA